jgi:hypothetical protein
VVHGRDFVRISCRGLELLVVQPAEQLVQAGSCEAPVKRDGGLLVTTLEAQQPLLDLGEL